MLTARACPASGPAEFWNPISLAMEVITSKN